MKPYQKEALKKLEELHGGMWPMVKQQFEGVIASSSEEQTKAIVKMISDARGNAAASANSDEEETAETGGPDAWEEAQAAREDLEKQISGPYDGFVDHVAKLGAARHMMAGQARDGIYKSEKGARLSGVSEMFTRNTFITNKSMADGLEELRLVREKLFESKKYYKVSLPSGNPPDNTSAVRAIVADGTKRITALNDQYAKIAAEIKKRIDNIPFYGPEKTKQIYDALVAERETHNKSLSAEAAKVANEINTRIAEQDRALFNWMIEPLKAAKPQSGPVAQR
ncbi:hypothetical protein MHY87_04505 [Microvirga sp. ACRRW]|uniref:hypothetical protein n=1 Tax=Microvirga sp. ACRRW TaxID=2918205 RepID=UPI001EF5D2A7|nr:hypothetical protein [Microvirga sp. ACRRW]MCG7392163.1 hypothetical protein [Microvirga sp. ACRRW]